MSSEALTWAKRQTAGSAGRKATLLLLADVASEHGLLWPGAEYLARILECNRGTVLQHLRQLSDRGLIGRYERRRASGARTSTVTLLAPSGDRGEMHDPREHVELGKFIAEHLSRDSQRCENPRRNHAEPKSGFPTQTNSRTNRDVEANASSSRSARESAKIELPAEFEHLRPHLRTIYRELHALAERHGARAVSARSLVSIVLARSHKPLVCAALDCAAHWDAKARPVRDVVSAYRHWLDRCDDLAGFERLDEHGYPLGAVVQSREGNVVHLQRPGAAVHMDRWRAHYPEASSS